VINKFFLHRNLFHILIAWAVLLLVTFACGLASGGAPDTSAPMEAPAAPEPTSILAEEPAGEEEHPSLIPEPTQSPAAPLPAIPERRRLTLEFPLQIRVGDSDRVRLTLEVDDLGNIEPTAKVEGNVVTGEVIEIPNLYETHNVIAEAKFDIAGLQVSPTEVISQTLTQGQPVTFYWSVLPEKTGVFRGTVWFYLRFVDKASGEESRRTVSAQLVEIEAENLLGLPINLVRTFGGVGSIVGAIVGFPFIEDIVKFIYGRRKLLRR